MKNKKVLWAILAVIVIAAAYILIAKPFTPKGDGSITVKVTDIIDNGMLMKIESLDTPSDWAQFIAIWTNGKLAEVGIETLPYADGDVLEFRMTVNEYAGK